MERDEIVAQFPRVEDRSEEVKKTLQSLKNKVKKKQKTLWSADKLTLAKTVQTAGDMKVEQDEIVAQFPRVNDRSEEVKKKLQSLKDKVKKKQKTLW